MPTLIKDLCNHRGIYFVVYLYFICICRLYIYLVVVGPISCISPGANLT